MDVFDAKQVREHLREQDALLEEQRIALSFAMHKIQRDEGLSYLARKAVFVARNTRFCAKGSALTRQAAISVPFARPIAPWA